MFVMPWESSLPARLPETMSFCLACMSSALRTTNLSSRNYNKTKENETTLQLMPLLGAEKEIQPPNERENLKVV